MKDDTLKYMYVTATPTWLVRAVHAIGLVTWCMVLYGFYPAVMYDHFFMFIISPMLVIFTLYYFISYGVCLFYKKFDLKHHFRLTWKYWEGIRLYGGEPTIDIFLPVCGEEHSILLNTWTHVEILANKHNAKVYVLDDTKDDLEAGVNKKMAANFKFNYLRRPDRGVMKKAGNLKYGYEHSKGEFVIIFDADFAPTPDFIMDLLPYMTDPKVAIVQSPQYFIHEDNSLSYGGAQIQESFYRYVQVARDRLDASICCGSNAIYRRSALDSIGGTVQVQHSEDNFTGFTLRANGWKLRYVPLILAKGISPNDVHSYFHQQHRWCTGSMTMMISNLFWRKSAISFKTRVGYFAGFMAYLCHPVSILFSFQLFYTLFVYNDYISISNGLIFYPFMAWSICMGLFFPIRKPKLNTLRAHIIQVYAYSHAIFSVMLKSSVGWIPTNAGTKQKSTAFKTAYLAAKIYLALYLVGLFVAGMTGYLHPFTVDYYSVQFWLFYNTALSILLVTSMAKSMREQ